MLTINPTIPALTSWELDPYGYGGNETFPPTVQVDVQNPFRSPILPPTTKTFASQPAVNSLPPTCNAPAVEYDSTPTPSSLVSASTPPATVSTQPSQPSPRFRLKSPASRSKAKRNSHDRKRPKSHIPRPPNVFMLYRADFLRARKTKKLQEVERTQQMWSIMASECWKRLPEEQKAHWQERARQAEAEHALKYPGYKYKPEKRTDEVKKRRQQRTEEEKKRHTEELLRTYLPGTMEQPIVEPSAPRKRKSRAKKKVEPEQPVVSSIGSSSASASLAATAQADPQPAVGGPVIANDLPAPAPAAPVVSETTAVNELYARYNRDKAAGMLTTTEMFNTQYIYPAFFSSQQSSFLPSSQIQVEYSGSSMVPNYFSGDIFQNLVLPPAPVAAAPSFPSHNASSSASISQARSVSVPGSGNFINGNIAHMSSPVDFPVPMYCQPENQHPELHLAEPQFISSADLSQINLNLDGLDLSSFINSDYIVPAPANFVQFAGHEDPSVSGFYGFNNGSNHNEISDVAVQTGPVMGQESGFGTLVTGDAVVAHMNSNPSADFTAVVSQAENQPHGTTLAEAQFPATVNPSEIILNQNSLGISTFNHLDSAVNLQTDAIVNHNPEFYIDKGVELGTTAHVDSVINQNPGYGTNNAVYMNPLAYNPAVVQPENQYPGINTANLNDGYGVFINTNSVGNVNPAMDLPFIVQSEDHYLGMNPLADQQFISTAPGHDVFETNIHHGIHCSDPTLSGIFVPDKPPPYLYQRAVDVPTNALQVNGNGNGNGY